MKTKDENIEDATIVEAPQTKGKKHIKMVDAQIYPELPGILVTELDNGLRVFDADKFLEMAKEALPIADYLENRSKVIAEYARLMKIPVDQMVLQSPNKPTLINAALALDFACWVYPTLMIFTFERLHEIFIDGFSVSNRYLGEASRRLPQPEQEQESK